MEEIIKMTRKVVLSFLNACFNPIVTNEVRTLTNGFENTYAMIRTQLLYVILLDKTSNMWELFIKDLSEFKIFIDTYPYLTNMENLVTDFFKRNAATLPSVKLHKENSNENTIEKDSHTEILANLDNINREIPKLIALFNDFWDFCCDIANISNNKRDTHEYSLAKLDAFICFNALYRYYDEIFFGNNIEDLKNAVKRVGVEIFSVEELENAAGPERTSTFNDIYDIDFESNFFKCPLLMLILTTEINIDINSILEEKNIQNTNYFAEIYSSLLFYPTSLIVKQINTNKFDELAEALHIINSDKDFWGENWSDETVENNNSSSMNIEYISNEIIRSVKLSMENLLKDSKVHKKLPPIPAFEEAVKKGYFAEQDSEGHYRAIKPLSQCLNTNSKLITIAPAILKMYIRKGNGTKYGNKTIENIISG